MNYHRLLYGDIRGRTLHLGSAQASSEGSGETTSLRRLIGCSAMQYVHVYRNLMMLLSNLTHTTTLVMPRGTYITILKGNS